MSNKYLEKIAIFGFSQKEKDIKSYIKDYNHVANHLNKHVGSFNDSYKGGDLHNPEEFKKYATSLATHLKSKPDFYKGYEDRKHVVNNMLHRNLGISLEEGVEKSAAIRKVPPGVFAKIQGSRLATQKR